MSADSDVWLGASREISKHFDKSQNNLKMIKLRMKSNRTKSDKISYALQSKLTTELSVRCLCLCYSSDRWRRETEGQHFRFNLTLFYIFF